METDAQYKNGHKRALLPKTQADGPRVDEARSDWLIGSV